MVGRSDFVRQEVADETTSIDGAADGLNRTEGNHRMAKKRVHELAKELNLTNNEMVQKLQGWGYDNVKSHSSTLEDDQVRAVLERVRAGQKPAVAPKPSSGVVIRRSRAIVEASSPKPAVVEHPIEEAPVPEEAKIRTSCAVPSTIFRSARTDVNTARKSFVR